MIVKDFNINDLKKKYYIGINQIKIKISQLIRSQNFDNEEKILNYFFSLIEGIQSNFKNSTVQFVKNKYILDQNHIYNACYFLQKSFFYKTNISKKQNIELLLYLSGNRQINKSIEGFGIDNHDLNSGKLTFCIISSENNIVDINKSIIQTLDAENDEITLNKQSIEKFEIIKNYFEISDQEITTVLYSYGINGEQVLISKTSLDLLYLALSDLICERMALLSIENLKIRC